MDFTISALESAKAGRQALNVVFEAGSDVNAAALGAAIDWLLVLRGLPQDGQYTAQVGAVRTEGGYILAIHLKVEEPGTLPSEPEPIPEGGYEVIEGVYHVYNEEGLKKWAEAAQKDLSTSCTLASDITLPSVGENESNWTPIGDYQSNKPYTGTFDGNNCTIKGLKISIGNNVGLFGFIGEKGKVENLTLKDAAVSGEDYVGGVAGISLGTITGCKAEGGSVSGRNFVGGVVAQNFYGTVTACYATGSVTGFAYVGGVAGWNGGPLTACYHAGGNVSGSWCVGGVAGCSDGTNNITACYWSGSVTPTTDSDRNSAPHGIGSINNSLTSATNDNATPVDSTTTWQTAAGEMNEAIIEWNKTHSNEPCNWHYEGGGNDAINPPTLAAGAPQSQPSNP